MIGVQCSYSAWKDGHHKWKIGQHQFILQLSFSDRSLTEKLSLKCFQSCQKLFFIFREVNIAFLNCEISSVKHFLFCKHFVISDANWPLFSELDFCHPLFNFGSRFSPSKRKWKTEKSMAEDRSCSQLFYGDRFTVIPSKCGFRIRLVRNFAQLLKSSSRFSVCGDSLCVELAGRAAIVTCLS